MGSMGERGETFVSEAIVPLGRSFLTPEAAPGAPGPPLRFAWRKREFAIARIVDSWKSTGDCRHKSGERYVRRHWFRVETTDGTAMTLYFDRQPRAKRAARWWLATVEARDAAARGETAKG